MDTRVPPSPDRSAREPTRSRGLLNDEMPGADGSWLKHQANDPDAMESEMSRIAAVAYDRHRVQHRRRERGSPR
ncbi:hypothetical protein Sviol_49710 [Streptomyces violascens]|uniref:Uncharacterized protein n=1 Tax=Streptomyces violascens TaxID=67381 RepID=A0ABQ3QTG7_9ACTN|nr:hypothetical protein Sviol_49710 [Streptomyces violascens]